MNILYLAPQPLYQDRGTSIANKMVIEQLSKRGETVDVVTYPEGEPVEFENVTIFRTPRLPGVRNIRPGFSWKKLVCDLFMVPQVFHLALTRRYDLIHAVEESVFIALLLKFLLGIPYTYDMDSSLAQQMVEKYPFLRHATGVLNYFEGLAVRHARAVVVVCDALGEIARRQHPDKVVTLHDVPLLDLNPSSGADSPDTPIEDLRERLAITGPMAMYVGNLEHYQGIDLLLESFARTVQDCPTARLVIIGGAEEHIHQYEAMTARLGIQFQVHFLGPRPLEQLSTYLEQADVLVSPRIRGDNTPMKIYSYLYSGRACLATDLWTHTQVLTPQVAKLAAPEPAAFAAALTELLQDEKLRERLGKAGVRLINEKYNHSSFVKTLNNLMDWLTPIAGTRSTS